MSQVLPPGQKKNTFVRKFVNKTRQDPLVPIGCLLTGGVLAGGLWSMKEGNAKLSQKFMRTRVLAQGATVLMLCIGGVMMGNRSPLVESVPKPTLEDKLLAARENRK